LRGLPPISLPSGRATLFESSAIITDAIKDLLSELSDRHGWILATEFLIAMDAKGGFATL
jgi:hypothetical protein